MPEVEEIPVPTVKQRLTARLLSFLVRCLCQTLRLQTQGETKALQALEKYGGGSLICWHGRTLIPTYYFRGRGFGTLISLSRDGGLMAEYQRTLGMFVIRGSSSRRGMTAVREALTFFKSGGVMLLTPDGPRGPTEIVQPGVLFLTRKSGKPIIPGGISASPCWRLKSWDRFLIPKPFSRAAIVFGDPFFVLPDESLETAAERLAVILNHLQDRADRAVIPSSHVTAGGGKSLH